MKIIAHRGASGHEPENTLMAVKAAMAMRVDAVEVDIHLADGELLIIHDRWLHKSTNGNGRIGDKSLQEVRALDAGKGEKIPTLWEVLELIDGYCDVNIELKAEKTVEPLLRLLQKSITELKFKQKQFLLSSFNHHLLEEIKRFDSQWRIGALTASLPLTYAEFAQKLDAYSVHIDVDFINRKFVEDAHARGLKVFAYTVDHEEDIEDLHRMQVDGIFTNFPTRSMVRVAHLQRGSIK